MERPDALIELHQSVITEVAQNGFPGGDYTEPVPLKIRSPLGTEETVGVGTAHVSIGIERIWFTGDRHSRLWSDETPGGSPRSHIALDLAFTDSHIQIDGPLGGTPPVVVVTVPAADMAVPSGPRQGEMPPEPISVDQIPLYGRLLVHDAVHPIDDAGLKNVAVDFRATDAPALLADAPPDEYVSHLFGPDQSVQAGRNRFGGRDPRVVWELDYAEKHWTTHCALGNALVERERLTRNISREEAERVWLTSVAAELAAAVRKKLAEQRFPLEACRDASGEPEPEPNPEPGIFRFLDEAIDVDPDGLRPRSVRGFDVVTARWDRAGTVGESLIFQVRKYREPLPDDYLLPPSGLAARDTNERVVVLSSGWTALRQIRDQARMSYCLKDEDFDDAEPARLKGSRKIYAVDSEKWVDLRAFEARIVDESPGRIVVSGKLGLKEELAGVDMYGFDAEFEIGFELGLGDAPRDANRCERRHHPSGAEPLPTLAEIEQEVEALTTQKCGGGDRKALEIEIVKAKEKTRRLPRTVGVLPRFNPSVPHVESDVWISTAAKALTALAILGAYTGFIGGIAIAGIWATGGSVVIGALTASAALELLVYAVVAYLAASLYLMGVEEDEEDALAASLFTAVSSRPGGSSLPLGDYIAVGVDLDRDIYSYFRTFPGDLEVTCVRADDRSDIDRTMQLIGGTLTDGTPWKVAVADAAGLIEGGRVRFFVKAGGAEVDLIAATSQNGRKYVRTPPGTGPSALRHLPSCP